MTVRLTPVSTFVIVTVVFGNTPPDVSLAVPRIAPVGNCATTGIASKISRAIENRPRHHPLRYALMFPPLAKTPNISQPSPAALQRNSTHQSLLSNPTRRFSRLASAFHFSRKVKPESHPLLRGDYGYDSIRVKEKENFA